MTAKELIDEFVQEHITTAEFMEKSAWIIPSWSTQLQLLRDEIKEAESEQARLMKLLVQIQRDQRCTLSKAYVEAIKQIVNGN